MGNVADIKSLRERAAECRALASVAQNAQARDDFLHAARIYEAIAAQAEALARRLDSEA
jgi:hypothetical protein